MNKQPMFEPSAVKAVVFDIGGVFLYPHPNQFTPLLVDLGVPVPADETCFRRAHHSGVAALARNPRASSTATESEAWHWYDQAYATELGVGASQVDAFRSAKPKIRWDWLHSENRDAFHDLHATGMPIAIVSNNTGLAPQQMHDHGICWVDEGVDLPRVAAIIDSALVGVAKPNPAIMRPALRALDVRPENVLYVGDTAHVDIVGATAAGMQAVQLDPFNNHTEYDHERVPDIAALNRQLSP